MLKMRHDGCCKNDVIWIQMVNGKRVLRARTAQECGYNVNMCFSVPVGTVVDHRILHLDEAKNVPHAQEYIDEDGVCRWGTSDMIFSKPWRLVKLTKYPLFVVSRASHESEMHRLRTCSKGIKGTPKYAEENKALPTSMNEPLWEMEGTGKKEGNAEEVQNLRRYAGKSLRSRAAAGDEPSEKKIGPVYFRRPRCIDRFGCPL